MNKDPQNVLAALGRLDPIEMFDELAVGLFRTYEAEKGPATNA